MQQLGRDRVAPPHQVEIVRGPVDQLAGQRPLAGKAQAAVRRFEQVRLAVVEAQAQAVAVQQHQFTVDAGKRGERRIALRSEEHPSELQSLIRTSYAGFCLKKKKKKM